MYFGSVRFFKHVIVVVTILLIVIPCVFCGIMLGKLGEVDAENQRLKAEIGEYRLSGHQTVYTAEELFGIYKENLEDKEEFLKLANQYDEAAYRAAAGLEAIPASAGTVGTLPAQTAGPDTPEDDTAVPDANVVTEIRPSYEALYPDLYADIPEDLVYNMDMDYVYLTFDDGPSKYTDSILDYLRSYDIKATFFVVPDGSDESNAKLKKIADAGHTIGIHTATHEYKKIYASVEAFLEDFKTAYDRVYEATGVKCTLFRFPGGSINDYNADIRDDLIAEMTRRGFIYFDWNVDSSDALGATWTEMYNSVLKQTADANRAVILMHDYNGGWNTVLVLEDIIKALVSDPRGYKLDRLTENVKPIQF